MPSRASVRLRAKPSRALAPPPARPYSGWCRRAGRPASPAASRTSWRESAERPAQRAEASPRTHPRRSAPSRATRPPLPRPSAPRGPGGRARPRSPPGPHRRRRPRRRRSRNRRQRRPALPRRGRWVRLMSPGRWFPGLMPRRGRRTPRGTMMAEVRAVRRLRPRRATRRRAAASVARSRRHPVLPRRSLRVRLTSPGRWFPGLMPRLRRTMIAEVRPVGRLRSATRGRATTSVTRSRPLATRPPIPPRPVRELPHPGRRTRRPNRERPRTARRAQRPNRGTRTGRPMTAPRRPPPHSSPRSATWAGPRAMPVCASCAAWPTDE